jgi:tetratricopeptide (TPR) repeat protein
MSMLDMRALESMLVTAGKRMLWLILLLSQRNLSQASIKRFLLQISYFAWKRMRHRSLSHANRILTLIICRLDEAADYHQKIVIRDSRRWEGWYGLGVCLFALGFPAEAIDRYNNALAVAPSEPQILVSRALAYTKFKNMDKALADATQALVLRVRIQKLIFVLSSAVVLNQTPLPCSRTIKQRFS